MNNSNLTNQDRAYVILDLMQKKHPAVTAALKQLATIASGSGEEAKNAAEVLQLVDQGAQGLSPNVIENNPVQFAKGGATFKSNCNCPSKLARQGGKLVIVDCHGQIIR